MSEEESIEAIEGAVNDIQITLDSSKENNVKALQEINRTLVIEFYKLQVSLTKLFVLILVGFIGVIGSVLWLLG